jgi:hypothetical protein
MAGNGSWSSYVGSGAVILAVVLFIIGGAFAWLGTGLRHSNGVARPGKAVGILLIMVWILSLGLTMVASSMYRLSLYQQMGLITTPDNPITAITGLSGLATFIIIIFLSRHFGWKTALGSAMVGAAAAPMVFELPFDLIIMWRTYPPTPAALYILLVFLPLFLVEISTFSLLTLSPLPKLSNYTLYSLAAMFLVFSVWALFGFSYPSEPLPIVLKGASEVLSFVTAITLFLPQKDFQSVEVT